MSDHDLHVLLILDLFMAPLAVLSIRQMWRAYKAFKGDS